MVNSEQSRQIPMKTCSLCNKSTEAEGMALIYFGEWMSKKEITVHYYCLLLSTHLCQRGKDHGGILGFLLRDIRTEIIKAKNRKCKYCLEVGATVQCFTCKKYFHMTCGHTSKCLTHFAGDFKSFCHVCIPDDPYKMKLIARRQTNLNETCFICAQNMGAYPKGWIYAKCCGNGFIHSKCMKMYALSAGYYLTCIWCKDKNFREDIKYQGVFVPDRDANWEKEKGAYAELHSGHKRCDMEVCNCPKGRDYSSSYKWQLILCKLCGAFGAHNPFCIPGYEGSKEKVQEFKCDICSVTEQTIFSQTQVDARQDLINTTLYVAKNKTGECVVSPSQTECILSQQTEVNELCKPASTPIDTLILNSTPENMQIQPSAYNLTQSIQSSENIQKIAASNPYSQKLHHELSSDSDESIVIDFWVQKVLDVFEVNAPQDENKDNKGQGESEIEVNEQQNPTGIATKSNFMLKKPQIVTTALL